MKFVARRDEAQQADFCTIQKSMRIPPYCGSKDFCVSLENDMEEHRRRLILGCVPPRQDSDGDGMVPQSPSFLSAEHDKIGVRAGYGHG